MLPAHRHRSARKSTAGNRICLTLNVSSAIAALTLGLTAVLQTPVMRATAPYKCAPTDERLGMNGGDPVCRLFRLSLSGFRSLLGLRCQPLGAELLKSLLRAFEAARRHHLGPIPCPQASRFRPIFQVLFCRGQSAFLPGSNAARSCPFSCNEGAWHTVKIGVRPRRRKPGRGK